MPRFSANLSMLFTEVPFLDRFIRARRAGFEAVEFLFPYDHPAQHIPWVTPLVTGIAIALDQPFRLVEVQGGHRHAAAGSELTDAEFLSEHKPLPNSA